MKGNIVGEKYYNLLITEDLGCYVKDGTKRKSHYVKCICDCGNEVIKRYESIKKGKCKSCGCMTKHYLSVASRKENKYTIDGNVVYVKMTNCDDYMICDIEDWKKFKKYSWCKNKIGYVIGYKDGKQIKYHQLLFDYDKDIYVIDHINGNKLDNRKSNLRIIEKCYNNMNISVAKNNKSGFTGVNWDKNSKKWISSIQFNKKRIRLGCFDNIEDAVKAREEAEVKYFGEYRRKKVRSI